MSETQHHSRKASRILLTLAGLAVIAALGALPGLAGPPGAGGLPDIAKFTGRFHPVLLHLPIGILAWVLVHECLALFGMKNGSSRTAMGLAAGSAVVASLLGILLYYSMPDYDAVLAQRHMDRGIAFTCLAIATWLVKVWVDAAGRGAVIYRGLLLGSAGVMAAASHDGGSLTHGSTYLTEYAPAPLRKLLGLPEKPSSDAAGNINTRPVYQTVIKPIFERKCYQCHNADRQRGKYRMDEYDLLLAGGNDGAAIIPGDAAASNLVVRIELPKDDEERMPPEGKKDLDDAEILLIKWWIDQGASPDALLDGMATTDEVLAALANVAGAAAAESETAGLPAAPELGETLKSEVERLRREYPAALNYESSSTSGLTFTAAGMRSAFGDDDLAQLEAVLPAMVSMDLTATSLTDEGVKMLAKATSLKSLRLSETAITEASLGTLARLTSLESLNLYGTQVGSPAVLKLAPLQKLRKLYLWRTQVDAAGVLQLGEKLPDCEIITGL
jgi:uncharacterized membrane protein